MVLGKRTRNVASSSTATPSSSKTAILDTPPASASAPCKRARTRSSEPPIEDTHNNKENVAPPNWFICGRGADRPVNSPDAEDDDETEGDEADEHEARRSATTSRTTRSRGRASNLNTTTSSSRATPIPTRLTRTVSAPVTQIPLETPPPTPVHKKSRLTRTATTPSLRLSKLSIKPSSDEADASPESPAMEVDSPGDLTSSCPSPTKEKSVYCRAKMLLRCNGTSALASSETSVAIAARDTERASIEQFVLGGGFLAPKSAEEAISTLYISGQPGTGKTALVTDVLRKLAERDNTSSLTSIYVNCTGLSDVKAVWDRVWEEVVQSSGGSVGSKLKPGEAKKNFENALKRDQGFRYVLVLDEVDYVSRTTSSLSEIYQFARNHDSSLRLIGIANTLTLGAEAGRSSPATPTKTPRAASFAAVGPQKSLNFTAYTHTDLSTIINARLAALSAEERTSTFNPAALNFLSKKVAAVNGDVRYCLSVLRRCVESAEKESIDGTGKGKVEMKHVLESLRAHESAKTGAAAGTSSSAGSGGSGIARTVRNLGLHPRLALVALLLGWKRLQADLPLTVGQSGSSSKSGNTSDVDKLTAPVLYNFYIALLTAIVVNDNGEAGPSTPFNPVSRGEFQDILGLLETSGLVSFPNEIPPALARSISGSASTPSFPTAPISPPKTPSRNRIIRSTSLGTPSRSVSSSGGGRKRVCDPCVVLSESVREEEVVRGLTTPVAADKGMTAQEKEVERVWTRELKRVTKEVEKRERKKVEEREKDAIRARAFEDAQD
ncbi:AAA ATPase [Tulasnella sp. 424]|nr:AAA ATPase [Tulasnella sp. 424]KAG8973166.1 AAA ATPase [Tulasnella sp. 425]